MKKRKSFQDAFVSANVTLRLPFGLVNKLQRGSEGKKYNGQYQTLICDILTEWAGSSRRKR